MVIDKLPKSVNDLALFDRANGVRGHYCVGFLNEHGTAYFWGKVAGKFNFCSAGAVYTDIDTAMSVFEALQGYIQLNILMQDKVSYLQNELKQETVKLNSCISDYSKLIIKLNSVKALVNEVDVVT